MCHFLPLFGRRIPDRPIRTMQLLIFGETGEFVRLALARAPFVRQLSADLALGESNLAAAASSSSSAADAGMWVVTNTDGETIML
jgi:hypothetical protein